MSKRILVVDDSKAMRLIVRRTLRQAGFECEVDEASNGVEALAAIEKARPDLVLSDWNMPEMNGYELLTQIRIRQVNVKLGFVTTETTPEMQAKAGEAGALFLIGKPFTPEQFKSALSPILG